MSRSIEEVKKYYDEAIYRKLVGLLAANPRIEYAYTKLLAITSSIKPRRILEIGCGMGEICNRLSKTFPEATVLGFDVSEKSIEIAGKLFNSDRVSFQSADDIAGLQIDATQQFDLIILMDVYEHIPVNSRNSLHSFIQKHISGNGFLFLSCPTPQHLDYLRKNKPVEIQPVDENITIPDLLALSTAAGLHLIHYNEVSVWHAADYFHAAFSNKLQMQPYSDYQPASAFKPAPLQQIITSKLKEKLNGLVRKQETERELEIKQMKQLIESKLGKEELQKIEDFGKR